MESLKSKIISDTLKILPNNIKITLQRSSSCCFRDKYKEHTIPINMVNFNKIIDVNTEDNFVIVEPNVTMDQITDYLLNLKDGPYMLPITPEFKHITIGGAVNGLGIESSSCKFGLFEKTILKYKVLLTDGTIIEVTKDNDYKDLFYALPGSYGTLGIVIKVYIRIMKTEPYVKMKYQVYDSPRELETIFDSKIKDEQVDFMEGIVLKDKTILSEGETTNIGYYDWIFNTSSFNFFWSKWYINHLEDSIKGKKEYEEFIPIKDYLFRWDRGAFWFASNRMKCNWWNRILYGYELTAEKLYKRAKKKDIYEREKQKVVQDLLIPLENMSHFIEKTQKIAEVYPLWLCPIRTFKQGDTIFSIPSNGDIYVDVGMYGSWQEREENIYPPDFYTKNKEIENILYNHYGYKFLCNMNYYSKDLFWDIYSREKYLKVKNKYDEKNNLLNIYDKVCSFYVKKFENK
jgi:FAD/FMN-containing dehydrogenase